MSSQPRILIPKAPITSIYVAAVIALTFLRPLPASSSPSTSRKTPPPLPILPIPSSSQLQWQKSQMSIFLHFGTNTYTDSEWGTGHADPSIFNPVDFDPTQWVTVTKQSGFSQVILTAKHHDGFCLWPSEYTDYSVKSSEWRDGRGDVVGELAKAAEEVGVGLGLYLSPWDRHEECYGKTLEYNEFYIGQMTELLTRYGKVEYIFLDGAKGEGEKDMEYYFDEWFHVIHQNQPGVIIFSDAGPDARWVGDEAGVAGSTCWSGFNRSDIQIGGDFTEYERKGDQYGRDWVPAECDVSIRPGWFWHPAEHPKSAKTLLEIYYKSVGRNGHLLLNVPPNSSGLISAEDVQVLHEFAALRESIFSNNLAKNSEIQASSIRGGADDPRFSAQNALTDDMQTYWAPDGDEGVWSWIIHLPKIVRFNVLGLQEPIQMGQRIAKFSLDALIDGRWKRVANGTTVGYQRLLMFPAVESECLRFVIEESRADPLVSHFGIYVDEVSDMSRVVVPDSKLHFNGSSAHHRWRHSYSSSAAM
uniref:alpha-L-fucosidase n=1 Tax=Kalanchoe fedtschenkoi TaxID=63787 RepID=A0A7N0TSS6_KALFE